MARYDTCADRHRKGGVLLMAVFVHFESIEDYMKLFDLTEPEEKKDYDRFMKLSYKEKVAEVREVDEAIHTRYNTDYVEDLEYASLGQRFY